MSIAPPNKASMAEGPALKLVHCTFTCGPMALSNQPLAFPTMACACVILGNAPTRMAVCVHPGSAATNPTISPKRSLLLTLLSPDDHGEERRLFCLFFLGRLLALGDARMRLGDEVSQSSIFQDVRGCVAHVQEQLVKRPVRQIADNQRTQLLGIAKRRQRTIDQSYDFAQPDFSRIAAQLVSALRSTHTLNDARVL